MKLNFIYLVISTFIIIICVSLIFFFKMLKKKNICIIITTFINDEKYNMYYKRVKKWINTNYNIYLVDSNNRGFNFKNKNYKQYLFDQSKQSYYQKSKHSSTSLELHSLLKIVKHYNLNKKYKFIYKLTGKYYFEDYNLLKTIDIKSDIILQNEHNEKSQHTELVGFKSSKIIEYLNFLIKSKKIFEASILDLIKKYKCKVYRLDRIHLHLKYKRGNGSILNNL